MFIEFVTIDPKKGGKVTMPINPEKVCFIAPAIMHGEIAGPDGEMAGKEVAVLNFGIQSLVVDCTVEEALQKLNIHSTRVIRFPKNSLTAEDIQEIERHQSEPGELEIPHD